MSNTPRELTRNQLAEFLPNARAVRAFEQLLKQVSQILPAEVTALTVAIEEAAIEAASGSAKADQALDLLCNIAQSLDVLATAPPVLDAIQSQEIHIRQLSEELGILSRQVSDLSAMPPPAGGSVTSITAGTGLTGGTITASGTIGLADQIVAGGPTGDGATAVILTWNAQGQLTTVGTAAITPVTIGAQPAAANLTTWAGVTPGTGVATALAVNVGTDGAFVVKGGALGTPSSGTATNLTGTAAGLTAGLATALQNVRTINGVNFDGTANIQTATANTSDYVAPTAFTPTLYGLGTAGVTTYAAQSGEYMKIGKLTIVTGYLVWTAATGTGQMAVGGLPAAFANVANIYPPIPIRTTLLAGSTNKIIQGLGIINNTYFQLETQDTNTGAIAALNVANATYEIRFSFAYMST